MKQRKTTEVLQSTSQTFPGSAVRDDTLLCQLYVVATALRSLGEACSDYGGLNCCSQSFMAINPPTRSGESHSEYRPKSD